MSSGKIFKKIMYPVVGTAATIAKVNIQGRKHLAIDVINISATVAMAYGIKTSVIDTSAAHIGFATACAIGSAGLCVRHKMSANHASHLIINMSSSVTYTAGAFTIIVSSNGDA